MLAIIIMNNFHCIWMPSVHLVSGVEKTCGRRV